jgi:hypothetical protein
MVALIAFAGCESAGVGPAAETRLALQVVAEAGLATAADRGTIHVEGPTPSTVSINPGQTVTIDDLEPGRYTVSLEAFLGSELESFGSTGVTVAAGETREANIILRSFVPTDLQVPDEVSAGDPVTVTFAGVDGADGYQVQWAANPGFTGAQNEEVTGTSATMTLDPGDYYVRVRARSPFGSLSLPSATSGAFRVRAAVESVEVAPPSAELTVGATLQLEVTVRTSDGGVVSDPAVTWASDTPAVATVTQAGLVTAVAAGEAMVTAESDGVTGASVVTVIESTAPTLSRYDVSFRPVLSTCAINTRLFRTEEELDYQDANGDVATSGPLVEPNAIESQWRAQGQTEWNASPEDKTWVFSEGSSGSQGTLEDQSGTCWSLPGGEAWLEFRVRLRDALGNWSDWTTTRLWLPATVEVTPQDQVTLPAGGSQQFTAVARDVNGDPVAGDPINWASYNGPDMGAIDAEGLYVLADGAAGLDMVYARAGEAYNLQSVRGPQAFQPDSWWIPCLIAPHTEGSPGVFRHFPMRVYQGVEYRFWLGEDLGKVPSGNPDLYIRLGSKPSTTAYDARSVGPGFDEEIVWAAPENGVVWMGIVAQAAYEDVHFLATTTEDGCGFPGMETLPDASPSDRSGWRLAPPSPAGRDQEVAGRTRPHHSSSG